jgi:Zn-dependent protease with chaperone function
MAIGISVILLGIPWLMSTLLRLISNVLTLLLANDSQRAEYLADSLGARMGGTDAMINVLHKLHMGDALATAASRFYEMGGKQGVLDVLRRKVECVPPREFERVARIEQWVSTRLDASHPPTRYRIQALQAWPVAHPEVLLSTDDIEAIQRELSQLRPDLEGAMLEDYRSWTER